ncbi:MAG: glycosyltransferase N-terminal domain-containing protein, partial [Simkaniaceae bacterium]|nr:glycosyltransferase N-terminal domain-containing protein [Simkaniaceae bacterium]
MIWLLYNIALSLIFPFFVLKAWKKGRLKLPKVGPVDIWIHAISMGETKAARALIDEIRKDRPDVKIALSSLTETGFEEAQKTIKGLAYHFIMPVDLPIFASHLAKRLKPKQFILVESDFWLNVLKFLKMQGTKISLVNGKLSEKSAKRYRFFKSLFKPIDLFCLQSELYKKRFQKLGVPDEKIHITGNLKLDVPVGDDMIDLKSDEPFITLASTHAGEEALLLTWLRDVPCKIFLAPRHPNRFPTVETLLQEMDIPYVTYTNLSAYTGDEKVILLNTMGKVMPAYRRSKLAIIGGTYVDIGGHNLFEPLSVGIPVFFGPYIHAQQSLADTALAAGVAFQLSGPSLINQINAFLLMPEKLTVISERALSLSKELAGAAAET